jgi:predicted PurR-regulated permease PerM
MQRRSVLEYLLLCLSVILLLYIGAPVFIPLFYSLLLALVLFPLVQKAERRGLPRWMSIGLSLLLVFVLFTALLLLMADQVERFMTRLPELGAGTGIAGVLHAIMAWLQRITPEDQRDWWDPVFSAIPGKITPMIFPMLRSLFGMVFNLFIIPVFTALLLYHRERWVAVLAALAGASWRDRLPELLHKAVNNYARFIGGMVQVYLIVGTLNSIGFLLLGVPNAILFGMITAIMTMIPYVGIIFSALLPITLAYTSTGDILMPVGVVAVLVIVQYLEANLIFPKIVGGRLGLNTLVSLLVIFAGGMLWGVAGMILFLPLVSILKLVSQQVPGWRPLRIFLGDDDQ